MDGHRFDEIARTLAGGMPRRGMLKALASGGLAAVAARVGIDGVAASKRNVLEMCNGRRNGRRSCKGQKSGRTSCEVLTKSVCASTYPGRRCCKNENQVCDAAPPNCECCGNLICTTIPGSGTVRFCTAPPTWAVPASPGMPPIPNDKNHSRIERGASIRGRVPDDFGAGGRSVSAGSSTVAVGRSWRPSIAPMAADRRTLRL